ncbi:hypothetical protein DFS34DRAFT_271275 [Phlyctochytrium arcticum]|nr:hypothetical protein DFS34DRAFT_271275 [Phlyctochytrium arcticum]
MDKNTLTIFRPVLDEPTVSGITEDGEEILKKFVSEIPALRRGDSVESFLYRPLSYQTKFDQNVAKIDFSSLLISEESKKSSSTATTTNNSQEAPAPLYVPTVEQVKQHIYYAYEEIRLTLDLVEGLLEDAKGISNPSTPKFLKLLAAPRRPPPRPQQHIQELQINISAKFEDLNFVSRHLEDAANRFDLLLNQDDAFYGKFAPSLRVHGWILQAHAARGLYVDYGFGNEWSALQPHYAEVNRDVGPAGKTSAEAAATLEVFHKQRKTVRIKLSDPDSAAQGETLQDFWARWSSTDEDEPPLNDLLNRLKQAQASLFEEGEFEIVS